MRILIVDDDSATVAFMELAFVAAGDVVDTATSVDEAFRQAIAQPPDVVLTDLSFGHDGADTSDGFRLLASLRESPATAHTGVLFVSGADLPEVMQATEDRGFDGFIAKPVDVALLIDRVHRLGDQVAARRDASDLVDRD